MSRSCLAGFLILVVALAAVADPVPAKKRVPAPKDAPDPKTLPAATVKRLNIIDAALADPTSDLRKLHAQAVSAFIKNPGFGVGRMGIPTYPFVSKETWSTDDLEREPTVKPADVEPLHLVNVLGLSFRTPPSFDGNPRFKDMYPVFKDGNPVFKDDRPHPVHKLPAPSKYRVQQMHLVGLLTHDEPTVYRTVEWMLQPSREPATRPIDPFEAAGLDRLRAGDDLFVRQQPNRALRLLGAIRATDGCLKCHDGRRGDLLGAFSYYLEKAAR